MVHLLAGQNKFKDKYEDPDVLSKFNEGDMVGIQKSIIEYNRLPSLS